MNRFNSLFCLVAALSIGDPSTLTAADSSADPSSSESSSVDLLATANERIRQHRQSPITVRVLGADGQPIEGAKVRIEQTRHAFKFGCNFFKFDSIENTDQQARYLQPFGTVFNYVTLPFYWSGYEPRRGETQPEPIDAMVRWCQGRGIEVKGHPLAWNHSDTSKLQPFKRPDARPHGGTSRPHGGTTPSLAWLRWGRAGRRLSPEFPDPIPFLFW